MEKLPIRVFITGGTAQAEMEISGRPALIKQIFVEASHGLFPGVDWIEISGVDLATGAQLKATIRP